MHGAVCANYNNRFEAPAAIAGCLIISRGGVPRCYVYAVYESVSKLHSLLDSLFKVPEFVQFMDWDAFNGGRIKPDIAFI